jgi:hypothetical protein
MKKPTLSPFQANALVPDYDGAEIIHEGFTYFREFVSSEYICAVRADIDYAELDTLSVHYVKQAWPAKAEKEISGREILATDTWTKVSHDI